MRDDVFKQPFTNPPPDAIFSLQIVHKYYEAVSDVLKTLPAMQKVYRMTIGTRINSLALDLLALLLRMQYKIGTNKIRDLMLASQMLDELKTLLRLAKDVSALKENHYIRLSSRFVEVGKMTGGLIAKLNPKTKSPA